VTIALAFVAAVLLEFVALHVDVALGAGTALVVVPFVVVVLATWMLHRDQAVAIGIATVAVGHAFWLTTGDTYWGARSILDAVSRAATVAVLMVVTTVHARRSSRVAHSAHTDALTGVRSRHGFFEQMPLADGGTHLLRSGSLLYLDLDGLKAVNDRRGHQAGDELIRTFARSAASVMRGEDLLGRFGGDEFVLYLPEADELAAWSIAETLLERLRHSHPSSVSASIGIAGAPAGATLDRVIQHADRAMYEAKRNGGDRAQVFHFERTRRPELDAVGSDADS